MRSFFGQKKAADSGISAEPTAFNIPQNKSV